MDQDRGKRISEGQRTERNKFIARLALWTLLLIAAIISMSASIRSCQAKGEIRDAWINKHQEYTLGHAIPMSKGKKGATIQEILEIQADRQNTWYLNFALWQNLDSGMYIIRQKINIQKAIFINQPIPGKHPRLVLKGPEFAEERWDADSPYVVKFSDYILGGNRRLGDDRLHIYMDLSKTSRYFQVEKY